MDQSRVQIGLQRRRLAPAHALVRRDHKARAAVVQPAGQSVRGEACEHHRMDRADPRTGQHGVGRFRDHRQIERHPVAASDTLCLHHIGEAADPLVQLAIADPLTGSRVIPLPDDRRLVAPLGQMPVDAVLRHVEHAVLEPVDVEVVGVEGGVLDLGEGCAPGQSLPDPAPEGLRGGGGFIAQTLIGGRVDVSGPGEVVSDRKELLIDHGFALLMWGRDGKRRAREP